MASVDVVGRAAGARELGQAAIGVLFASTAVLVTASAALAARLSPWTALTACVVLVVVALFLAGWGETRTVWIAGLALLGVGVGLGNTGSVGVLLASVESGRIVTAMIVWSQIGILGYLVGPALGGVAADAGGYGAVALVPLAAALLVVATAHVESSRRSNYIDES
jgi:MFS family permease